jgi:hypothetical protein
MSRVERRPNGAWQATKRQTVRSFGRYLRHEVHSAFGFRKGGRIGFKHRWLAINYFTHRPEILAAHPVLGNYTFLTSRASALRTNVYAGPMRPFLRGFSNNEENQVALWARTTANGTLQWCMGPGKRSYRRVEKGVKPRRGWCMATAKVAPLPFELPLIAPSVPGLMAAVAPAALVCAEPEEQSPEGARERVWVRERAWKQVRVVQAG